MVNSLKNNQRKQRKSQLMRLFLLAVIVFSLWFAASNIYKYSIGYYAFKTFSSRIEAQEITPSGNELTKSEVIDEPSLAQNKETSKELYPVRPDIGDDIGELYIPKLDAILPIYHGTSEDELEKGVGHYADSVLPGENDNSVLSGHRDTVFRKLGEVGEGDILIVRTVAGEFEYKVSKVRIVDAEDRTVIVPKPKATLTISTCYPFEYIGSAPKRYILVAYLASETIY